MSSPSPSPPPLTAFSNPAGFALVKKTIQDTLGLEPHGYQTRGVCATLDGRNLLAIIPTGGGKTGFVYMYLRALLQLRTDPRLHEKVRKKMPERPALVYVLPTNGLEFELAIELERRGIPCVVINSFTLHEADRQGVKLWEKAENEVLVILLSPEMLSGKRFGKLLQLPVFRTRARVLTADEIQFLDSWGADFRKSFRQIGNVLVRMGQGVSLIAMTATLLAGAPGARILKFLSLKQGDFLRIQRSNLRPTIRMIFRPLTAGMGGQSFPDLLWVLKQNHKVLIFTKTINLCFRVLKYLMLAADGTYAEKCVRIRSYHAVHSEKWNAKTRERMHNDPKAQVGIATDTLAVGVSFALIKYVIVMVGEGETLDMVLQKVGRIRDTLLLAQKEGIAIVYYPESLVAHAEAALEIGDRAKAARNRDAAKVDHPLAKMMLASCKRVAQDELYGNPAVDEPCSCARCTPTRSSSSSTPSPVSSLSSRSPWPTVPSCACSGCKPVAYPFCTCEDCPSPSVLLPDPPTKPKRTRQKRKKGKYLRKYQWTAAKPRLVELRDELYHSTASRRVRMSLPPFLFLPEALMDLLLNNYYDIIDPQQGEAALDTHLASSRHMKPHAAALREVLIDMEPFQDEVMVDSKAERARKKTSKAALGAGNAVDDGGATSGSDDGSSIDGGLEDDTHHANVRDANVGEASTLPAALASSLPRRVPRPVPYRKAAVPNGRALSSGANPASHDTAAAVTSSLTSASPRSGRRNTADPPTTSGATSGAGVASPARDSPSPRPSSSSRIPRPALHAPARPTRPSVRPTDLPGRPLDAPRAHGAPTSAPPSSSSLLVDAPVAPTRFYGSSSGALGSRSRDAPSLPAGKSGALRVAASSSSSQKPAAGLKIRVPPPKSTPAVPAQGAPANSAAAAPAGSAAAATRKRGRRASASTVASTAATTRAAQSPTATRRMAPKRARRGAPDAAESNAT